MSLPGKGKKIVVEPLRRTTPAPDPVPAPEPKKAPTTPKEPVPA